MGVSERPSGRHITVIAMHYPPEIGAAAQRTSSLVAALTAQGHRVRVITQLPNYLRGRVFQKYAGRFRMVEDRGGATVSRVRPLLFRRQGLLWRTIGELWFLLNGAARAMLGPRPCLVLATCPSVFAPLAGWAAATARRAALVIEVRDLTWENAAGSGGRPPRAGRWLGAAIVGSARHAALVVCTNARQRDHMVARGVAPERCRVVPPGVDRALLDRLSALPPPPGRRHVMYLGLVGLPQGLRVLIDTARLLADEGYRITVVGGGVEREALAAAAEREGVGTIAFAGPVPPEAVPDCYASADILVAHLTDHPSYRSALPSKLLEYMAAGRPVVFGGAGAGADLVRESGGGIAVPPCAPEEMAAAIRRLAEDPELADSLSRAGREFVRRRHARDAILGDLLADLAPLLS